MRVKNYKSDFKFLFGAHDIKGHRIDLTALDWTAVFRTSSKAITLEASRSGGEYKNCIIRDGAVCVIAKGHGLPPGRLQCELTVRRPDEDFPDGICDEVIPDFIGIYLTEEKGDCMDEDLEIEADMLLPFIKGEPFRYEDFTVEQLESLRGPEGKAFEYSDFTPEQIAELQKPATEAAKTIKKAEDMRVSAENKRVEAEKKRTEDFNTLKTEVRDELAKLSAISVEYIDNQFAMESEG